MTGAGSGIGRETAITRSRLGATPVLSDISPEPRGDAATICGLSSVRLVHDLADEGLWNKSATTIKDRFGRLDVLVNNAGIMVAPEELGCAESDYVSYALALIEIAAADGALSTIVSIQNLIMVAGLRKDGTTEQKARFLPDLLAGRCIGAFALMAPK